MKKAGHPVWGPGLFSGERAFWRYSLTGLAPLSPNGPRACTARIVSFWDATQVEGRSAMLFQRYMTSG